MNRQTRAVLAEEILEFAVYTTLVEELKTTIRNHLFPQPAGNEWMDGLVIFLALLYQHLLCNVQQEGTRKWCDSTHNATERKTEADLLEVELLNMQATITEFQVQMTFNCLLGMFRRQWTHAVFSHASLTPRPVTNQNPCCAVAAFHALARPNPR